MASGSKKVIIAALIGNSLIAVTKFIAAAVTRSSAMFAEAIHSVVDTGNQVLLLFGLKRSQKPADETFPFGHGKEIYFWSFVVAVLLFALGSGISLYEGIHSLMDPHPIESAYVNYIVLGLAIVFEAGAWYIALREFNQSRGRRSVLQAVRQGKDPNLFVVLFEDTAAMLGLVAALIGVLLSHLLGWYWADGMASVVIGVILAITACWLAYESKSLLIGEAADPAVVRSIRRIIGESAPVQHVNEVLTLHMGPNFILVAASADFETDTPAQEVKRAVAQMTEQIRQQHPDVKRVFVEAEERDSASGALSS